MFGDQVWGVVEIIVGEKGVALTDRIGIGEGAVGGNHQIFGLIFYVKYCEINKYDISTPP